MTSQPQTVTMMPEPNVVQVMQPQVVDQSAWIQSSHPLHRRKNTLFGLGITEVVFGGLSIILASIAFGIGNGEARRYYYDYYYGYYYYSIEFTYSAQGIWNGLFAVITGALGIRVKNSPTKCQYIANMTMAIITANFSFAAFILSVIAALQSYFSAAMTALHSMIAVFTFVSFILSIIHAAFCCGGACMNQNSVPAQHVTYIPQQNMIWPPQPNYMQGGYGQFSIANQAFSTRVNPNMTQPTLVQNAVQHVPQSASQPIQMTQPSPGYIQPASQSQQV